MVSRPLVPLITVFFLLVLASHLCSSLAPSVNTCPEEGHLSCLGSVSGIDIDPGIVPRLYAKERDSIYPENCSYSLGQSNSAQKCQSI